MGNVLPKSFCLWYCPEAFYKFFFFFFVRRDCWISLDSNMSLAQFRIPQSQTQSKGSDNSPDNPVTTSSWEKDALKGANTLSLSFESLGPTYTWSFTLTVWRSMLSPLPWTVVSLRKETSDAPWLMIWHGSLVMTVAALFVPLQLAVAARGWGPRVGVEARDRQEGGLAAMSQLIKKGNMWWLWRLTVWCS